MSTGPEVRVKRVYEPAEPDDGTRVLVDRLWPRGLTKQAAALDEWPKDVAPSTELRRSWHSDPERHDEFAARYRDELDGNPEVHRLAALAAAGTITLLTATKDPEASHARVIADLIAEQRAAAAS
jgi:uncharacterized protein YeaO (DUF488 family)